MADEDLIVTISGPALSVLLYENARAHDQIGFLLGEWQMFITKKVTDSDRAVESTQIHINIKSIVAHPLGCEAFFDSVGRLKEDRLREFLKSDIDKVVGWYHYSYNHHLNFNSLRDKNLHSDLAVFFSNKYGYQKREHFLYFLMTTNENETRATHKFRHILYRREGMTYKPVPFSINNLGADASRPDGSDYKPSPNGTSCQNDSFKKVYDSLRNDLQRKSGVEAVQIIEKGAEALLAKLIPEVSRTDKIVSELSEKLFIMRHEFYQEQFEKDLLRWKMEQCSMDVDVQPSTPLSPSLLMKTSPSSPKSPSLLDPLNVQFEPKSPESPLMFNPPKISPPSSNVKLATTKNLKQESSEYDQKLATQRKSEEQDEVKFQVPKSPPASQWKSIEQRKVEYAEYIKARDNTTSKLDRKGARKSPDFSSKNS